ncbi:FadR/GntR family transcriptional regulator [Prescottella agglutinans]|uniref:DNA-binding FadR family transcriptional regulator n=1 Tax=Prescottella agglutinans TaxID=1644129 RepID=A0ABT6M7Y9_9NOCA|nr:FCD domain-containing protein [Prescottella agglutinans]MDH6280417.1 DNA-binding FadR family transcriptional regulator [Prescottella agglutinans]
MTAALTRNLLTDQVADQLRRRLQAGEWEIGSKLPGETTLAAQLGVGRSTIREALRMLAGQGMLRARQGAGVFVERTEPEFHGWEGVLQREAITAVVEVRAAIEIEAARLAALRATDADVAAMRRALELRADAADAPDREFVDADIAVHRAVVAAAHNPVLSELFETFVPRLADAMTEMIALLDLRHRDTEPNADEHAALVDAIAAGDVEGAARVSRAHLEGMAADLG